MHAYIKKFNTCIYVHIIYYLICLILAPPVPLDLKVTSTHNTIFLSWKLPPSSSTSSIKYILEWKKVIEQSFSHVQNITATNFEVDELIPNTEYQFQVAAVDSGICGSFTDIVCQYTSMLSYQS